MDRPITRRSGVAATGHEEQVDDVHLLTVLFAHFRQRKHLIDIALQIFGLGILYQCDRPPWGRTELDVQTRDGFTRPVQGDTHLPTVLFDAMALSGFEPSNLRLGGPWWCLPLHSFSGTGQQLQNTEQVFSSLKRLDLHLLALWDWPDETNPVS